MKIRWCLVLVCVVLLLAQPAYGDDEIKVKGVSLSATEITVRVNQTRSLFAQISPRNADDPALYWSSDNENVVMVDGDGVLTGIAPGTAVVTAASGNGKSAACTVTVPAYALGGIPQDVENAQLPQAEVDGGELLTVTAVKAEVERQVRAARPGHTPVVTFRDKSLVSADVLRAAAYTAEYEDGKVMLCIETSLEERDELLFGNGAAVQGSITMDPHSAQPSGDINARIYTRVDRVEPVKTKMEKYYTNCFSYIICGQQGAYGMQVNISAKFQWENPPPENPILYHYDRGTNVITRMDESLWQLAGSRLTVEATQGGAYVLSDGALCFR